MQHGVGPEAVENRDGVDRAVLDRDAGDFGGRREVGGDAQPLAGDIGGDAAAVTECGDVGPPGTLASERVAADRLGADQFRVTPRSESGVQVDDGGPLYVREATTKEVTQPLMRPRRPGAAIEDARGMGELSARDDLLGTIEPELAELGE